MHVIELVLLSPVVRVLILDSDLLSLHNLPIGLPRQFALVLRSQVAIVFPSSGDSDGVVVPALGLDGRSTAHRAAAMGDVVAAGGGLDVADEDSENRDAGGDDGYAGFGVTPDEQVDTWAGIGGRHGRDLGGLDNGGDTGEDTAAHGDGDTNLFLHLHLEAPD